MTIKENINFRELSFEVLRLLQIYNVLEFLNIKRGEVWILHVGLLDVMFFVNLFGRCVDKDDPGHSW